VEETVGTAMAAATRVTRRGVWGLVDAGGGGDGGRSRAQPWTGEVYCTRIGLGWVGSGRRSLGAGPGGSEAQSTRRKGEPVPVVRDHATIQDS
jgi:hypothetical protein